jgi:CHAD domain-containing protein
MSQLPELHIHHPNPEPLTEGSKRVPPWLDTAQDDSEPLPERGRLTLDRTVPLRDAVAAAFTDEVRHALAVARHAGSKPVRAVHELRKSVRRARALVRLVRPLLPQPTRVALEKTLGQVARSTSAHRDTEVLPVAMRALNGKDRKQFTALEAELWAQREALRRSGEVEPLLRASAEQLERLPPMLASALRPDLSWEDLGIGLRDSYRRARKALLHAAKHPNHVLIHDWRKRAKDLRHQLELVVPEDQLGEVRHEQLVGVLKDLGQITDLIALRNWARDHGAVGDDRGARGLGRAIKAQVQGQFDPVIERGRRYFRKKAKHFAAQVIAVAESAAVPERPVPQLVQG